MTRTDKDTIENLFEVLKELENAENGLARS